MKKWMLILCAVLLAGCAGKKSPTANECPTCQEIKEFSTENWSIYRAPEYNKKLQEEARKQWEEQKRKGNIRIEPFRFSPGYRVYIKVRTQSGQLWHDSTWEINSDGYIDFYVMPKGENQKKPKWLKIKAAYLTVLELRKELEKQLSLFVSDPKVVLGPSNGHPARWYKPPARDGLLIKNDYSLIPAKFSAGESVFEFILSQVGGPYNYEGSKFRDVFIIRIDWKTMELILVVCDGKRFLRMVDMNQDILLKRHDIIYLPTKAETANEFKKQLEFLKRLMTKVEVVMTYKTFKEFKMKVKSVEKENAAKSYAELLKSLGGK